MELTGQVLSEIYFGIDQVCRKIPAFHQQIFNDTRKHLGDLYKCQEWIHFINFTVHNINAF